MTKNDQLLEKAIKISKTVHQHQKYGQVPYFHHILDVVRLTQQHCPYFIDRHKAKICAYLHDTVEDSDTTLDNLSKNGFPQDIIDAIYILTDEDGLNRKERKLKTYEKIKNSNNLLGIFVKMCDRIANTEYSIKSNNKAKLSMYQKEYKLFKEALYRKELDFLWKVMDKQVNQK